MIHYFINNPLIWIKSTVKPERSPVLMDVVQDEPSCVDPSDVCRHFSCLAELFFGLRHFTDFISSGGGWLGLCVNGSEESPLKQWYNQVTWYIYTYTLRLSLTWYQEEPVWLLRWCECEYASRCFHWGCAVSRFLCGLDGSVLIRSCKQSCWLSSARISFASFMQSNDVLVVTQCLLSVFSVN